MGAPGPRLRRGPGLAPREVKDRAFGVSGHVSVRDAVGVRKGLKRRQDGRSGGGVGARGREDRAALRARLEAAEEEAGAVARGRGGAGAGPPLLLAAPTGAAPRGGGGVEESGVEDEGALAEMVERIRREREAKARGEFFVAAPGSAPHGLDPVDPVARPSVASPDALVPVTVPTSGFVSAEGGRPTRFGLPGRGVTPGAHHNSLRGAKHQAFLKAFVR